MRRICVSALLVGALSGSAFADPLQVIFSPYGASQPVYLNQPVYANQPVYTNQQVYMAQPAAPAPAASQQYYVYAAQPQYPATAAQSYVPAAAPGYAAAPAPSYASAAAPSYTGSIAPSYGTTAPPNNPAPAAPMPTAAVAPAYTGTVATVAAPLAANPAPQNPGGGGFLQAIFGGPTIQVQRTYQPALPEYQSAPQPQVTVINPVANYAPAGQSNPAAYPVDPRYDRQVVEYHGEEKPGTIVIDTPNKFLYLVEDGGKALRYGIGVGRPGFTWAGVKTITAKREWPDWRPPSDMLERRPDLPRYMPGGIDNPLGARAMYLGSTLYRIHGSNEPWTIGTNVSSGCIRMRNEDVTDLYGRVKVGTKVVVI
jgi:lipoprotein-anchoring transpeptidase ErfK/SrfK